VKLTTHLHLELRSKNEWSYTSTPPVRLHGVVLRRLKKGKFIFVQVDVNIRAVALLTFGADSQY
jgi:hypothetical protein